MPDKISAKKDTLVKKNGAIKKKSSTPVKSSHQELLQIALEAAHLGIWEWDINKNTVEWTDILYDIYGLKKGEPIDFERFQCLIFEQYRDLFFCNIQRTL
jgi:PAS domain-containing protein